MWHVERGGGACGILGGGGMWHVGRGGRVVCREGTWGHVACGEGRGTGGSVHVGEGECVWAGGMCHDMGRGGTEGGMRMVLRGWEGIGGHVS